MTTETAPVKKWKKADYKYVIHIFRLTGNKRHHVNSLGFKDLTGFAEFLLIEPNKADRVGYAFQTRQEAEKAGTVPNLLCLGKHKEEKQ